MHQNIPIDRIKIIVTLLECWASEDRSLGEKRY
jgi:hypothetical protein